MGDTWRQEYEEEEFEEIYASARQIGNRARRGRTRRAASAMLNDTDDENEENQSEDEEESDDEEMETEEDTEGDDVADDDDRCDFEGDDSCVSDSTISSLGSSTGNGKDQCPICLMTLKGQQLGKPNNCQHVFCLECIQEWAKNVNTCPVDRKKFNQISVHNSKKGAVISKIKVEDRQMEDEFEEDDPTFCEVCNQCDREDVLLLCDGCDKGYHMDCLTPPLFHVPIEEWFCHQCRHGDPTENVNEPTGTSRVSRRAAQQTRSRGTRSRSRGRQPRRSIAGSKYFLRENIAGSKYFLRGFKQKWNKFMDL